MDPRDRPRPLPDGATCTACGAPVPSGRIRILARRDDLAFVELACPRCGSAALGLIVPSTAPDGEPTLDVAAEGSATDPASEGASHAAVGRSAFRPISEADVGAIRSDLAAWDGDLVGWLDALDRGDRRESVVDR
jgi:hypothetical protein